MKRVSIIFLNFLMIIFSFESVFAGPYSPAAGEPGSTAIHMDNPAFVGWSSGYVNYNPGTELDLQWQTPEKALGKAVGSSDDIVSLGRGGSITMTFDTPIIDAEGWDFAVFENALNDTFLELAYVEVSSDGTNFYRFDNNSLTPKPVGGFGAVEPTNITGYGGKYRQGYGTPFDLASLIGISGLDVSSIGWVRIVDIVGDGTYSDTYGGTVYDPYPTVQSAGFDLDAIGVINQGFVEGDFDGDGDVDGADLAAYVSDAGDITLESFAADFGKIVFSEIL